eukprot:768559-Hanusia_phi.AAC.1
MSADSTANSRDFCCGSCSEMTELKRECVDLRRLLMQTCDELVEQKKTRVSCEMLNQQLFQDVLLLKSRLDESESNRVSNNEEWRKVVAALESKIEQQGGVSASVRDDSNIEGIDTELLRQQQLELQTNLEKERNTNRRLATMVAKLETESDYDKAKSKKVAERIVELMKELQRLDVMFSEALREKQATWQHIEFLKTDIAFLQAENAKLRRNDSDMVVAQIKDIMSGERIKYLGDSFLDLFRAFEEVNEMVASDLTGVLCKVDSLETFFQDSQRYIGDLAQSQMKTIRTLALLEKHWLLEAEKHGREKQALQHKLEQMEAAMSLLQSENDQLSDQVMILSHNMIQSACSDSRDVLDNIGRLEEQTADLNEVMDLAYNELVARNQRNASEVSACRAAADAAQSLLSTQGSCRDILDVTNIQYLEARYERLQMELADKQRVIDKYVDEQLVLYARIFALENENESFKALQSSLHSRSFSDALEPSPVPCDFSDSSDEGYAGKQVSELLSAVEQALQEVDESIGKAFFIAAASLRLPSIPLVEAEPTRRLHQTVLTISKTIRLLIEGIEGIEFTKSKQIDEELAAIFCQVPESSETRGQDTPSGSQAQQAQIDAMNSAVAPTGSAAARRRRRRRPKTSVQSCSSLYSSSRAPSPTALSFTGSSTGSTPARAGTRPTDDHGLITATPNKFNPRQPARPPAFPFLSFPSSASLPASLSLYLPACLALPLVHPALFSSLSCRVLVTTMLPSRGSLLACLQQTRPTCVSSWLLELVPRPANGHEELEVTGGRGRGERRKREEGAGRSRRREQEGGGGRRRDEDEGRGGGRRSHRGEDAIAGDICRSQVTAGSTCRQGITGRGSFELCQLLRHVLLQELLLLGIELCGFSERTRMIKEEGDKECGDQAEKETQENNKKGVGVGVGGVVVVGGVGVGVGGGGGGGGGVGVGGVGAAGAGGGGGGREEDKGGQPPLPTS